MHTVCIVKKEIFYSTTLLNQKVVVTKHFTSSGIT